MCGTVQKATAQPYQAKPGPSQSALQAFRTQPLKRFKFVNNVTPGKATQTLQKGGRMYTADSFLRQLADSLPTPLFWRLFASLKLFFNHSILTHFIFDSFASHLICNSDTAGAGAAAAFSAVCAPHAGSLLAFVF